MAYIIVSTNNLSLWKYESMHKNI